ncbi:phospholipase D-like domain-containing protein [Herbaspirillum rhizosphaerae]|uniref:phospholipase D-like domain-containing protein n=1 Tax=Herbaspirillum rhizosphaerae TaxID=346179 RepID=UPI00067CF76E|nr:phospholipase D-like domain-containing protein [Herbaspirillum rhizosphaerae]
MQNAVAFADNDVVVIAWSYGRKLPGCMGFAVYRIDAKGKETALPSMAVFPGTKRVPAQTTAQFPIQKFYWKDPYARLIAGKGNRSFRYKIVPLEGTPGNLTPMRVGFAVSNEVTLGPQIAPDLQAYFNRGLISTQRVSRAMDGHPDKESLLNMVAQPGNAMRKSLAGDMIAALLDFVARAGKGGTLYAALYELGDDELIGALEKAGKKLHLILSNPKAGDQQSASGITDGNDASRKRLRKTAGVLIDRMVASNHIAHNKFLVYVDAKGKPQAVLFGSTNWTSTGLCTQTNNTIVSDDAALAKRYLDYWNQLAADTEAAGDDAKALQGAKLRAWDARSKVIKQADSSTVTSWFSPNTPKARGRSRSNEARPSDIDEVAALIAGAQHAVLFLAFYPGTPSIVNWVAQAQKANKDLFVRGCVTNPSSAAGFLYELQGVEPPKRKKGDAPGKQDPRVISAKALTSVVPAGWQKEILSAGFAVTHDKIVVIDPFSDNCVVVTGSHNLGYKASYDNDDNLAIFKGQQALAQAYATHVLDIYDHFSWRWMVQEKGQKAADTMLSVKPDEWQGKYFGDQGEIRSAQLRFWLGAIPALR